MFSDFLLTLLESAVYVNILAFYVILMELVRNVILFYTVKPQIVVVNVSNPLSKIVKIFNRPTVLNAKIAIHFLLMTLHQTHVNLLVLHFV